MAKRTAIIDIGSNSARMIIIERTSRFGFYLLEEVKSRVRIGEGAYENGGLLQPKPMERGYRALKEFLNIAKSYKVRKILCVATSALRDAPNKNIFLNRIKKELKLNIKVIDGEKEAFFGGIAALNLLPIKDGITIDIGGGSTELALIQNSKVLNTISLNLGTVRLKELFFDKGSNIKDAIEFIKKELEKIPDNFSQELAIGIGGTIRALSKSIMQKNQYPLDKLHAFEYELNKEIKYIEKIINSPTHKLKKFYIKKDRFDTIREGALIFAEILKYLNIKKIITSGVGVREGVFLYDLLRNSNYKFPYNFNPSVKSLLDRFCLNEKNSKCFYKNASKIYDAINFLFDKENRFKNHLLIAAKLSNIGIKIDFYEHHKHSSYIILNDLEYKVTHKDIVLISTLIRFHKKKLPANSYIKDFKKLLPSLDIVNWLSFILTLAEIINKDLSCPKFEIFYENKILYIKSENELYLAKEEIKNIKKPAPFAIKFIS
ncbi:Ppx/GppA phosphatase family protein [Nitrosophilus kaiyonis]|uniref:Ppx/GppA phosphatase family protein n=1 Tax=Nitrosophilus kaiyonis TaxID=2930200 RepID=UPI00249357D5|nr:Ppx/GppA phosphatase family protein [Nitrosophilus kaiyonis]